MRQSLRRAAALAALAALSVTSTASAEVYGDVDFLLLSASIPSTGFNNIWYREIPAGIRAEGSLDDGLQFATRLTLGYEDCSCFGGRVRWFSFDNDLGYNGLWVNGTTIPLLGTTNLDVDALDFDITQGGSFGYWKLIGSAGLRYGRVDLMENSINFEDVAAFVAGVGGVQFEGVGPTLSLEGRRQVAGTGLSIFASGRTSLLWGDADVYTPFFIGNLLPVRDEIVQVWEIQLGVEYAKTLSNGMTAETGVFWEAQRWDSENNTLGDLSFMGLGIHAGLSY